MVIIVSVMHDHVGACVQVLNERAAKVLKVFPWHTFDAVPREL